MRHQFGMSVNVPGIVLLVCVLFGLFSWMLLSNQINQLAQQAVFDKGNSTLQRLHELTLAPLFNNDTISVQVALKKATEDPSIISASLYGIDQELITQSSKSTDQTLKTETFTRNLEFQNTQVGILSVEVDSQPIYQQYQQPYTNWLILWLLFTLLSTYICHRYVDNLRVRIVRLSNRLPGNSEQISDELNALEKKVQPLLSNIGESNEDTSNTYYYSLINATIKNRLRLNNQLNQDNLNQLFEKLDYCILRTLQLYGGTRIEGEAESICFTIRSTQCSKQHLLVCLMAVYSLRQLVENLSIQLGVDLEVNWTLSSQNISTAPQFFYEQGIATLKQQNMTLANRLQKGLVVLNCDTYSIEELTSIARFATFDEHCFILEGFSENRQQLLEKQLEHLTQLCLSA